MITKGRIIKNDTYGECARITFYVDQDDSNATLDISDKILRLFENGRVVRISSCFDIVFV